MVCPFKFRSDVKIRISTMWTISFYKSKEIYHKRIIILFRKFLYKLIIVPEKKSKR